MKIYGKSFLYFGSSLKTVLSGELSWATTALNFRLPLLLFRNLLKNRFLSIKCATAKSQPAYSPTNPAAFQQINTA